MLQVLVLAQALSDFLRLLLLVGIVFSAGFIQSWGGRAVHLEPPVANEVGLAEDGTVGAEEGDLPGRVADVEYLEEDIDYFLHFSLYYGTVLDLLRRKPVGR